MTPTTVGTGPWKPAIEFNDTRWILEEEFPSERAAYERAHYHCQAAIVAANIALREAKFLPKQHR